MTYNTYIDIQFAGENFSPNKLKKLTNLPLEILVETGDIAKKGRYKGKPSPFGLALLKIEPNQNSISKWCDILLSKSNLLAESNVREIVFDIESANENFSNFSINKELTEKLSQLDAIINFTKIPKVEVDEFIQKIFIHFNDSSINNKKIIFHNLKIIGEQWSHEHMSPRFSFAIAIYLLESINSKKVIELEKFQKYIDEFQE